MRSVAHRQATAPEQSPAVVAHQLFGARLGTRLAARVGAGPLDRALIAGADPAASRRLAARAARLSSNTTRIALADGLDGLVRAAAGPHRRWWALSRHEGVLANRDELHSLATLLRGTTPVYARGIALLNETLTDGTGPAYHGDATALARRLSDARAALGGAVR